MKDVSGMKKVNLIYFFSILVVFGVMIMGLPVTGDETVKVESEEVKVEDATGKIVIDSSGVTMTSPDGEVNVISSGVEVSSAGGSNVPIPIKEGEFPAAPDGLKKIEPISCMGSDDKIIKGRIIETDGDGANIMGNCDVAMTDCYIVVKGHGIKVLGNADVKLTNCMIKGNLSAMNVSGNATVVVTGCTFMGGISSLGNADFLDKGGNVMIVPPKKETK